MIPSGAIGLQIKYLPYRLTKKTNWKEIDDPLFEFRNLGGKLGYINSEVEGITEAVFSWRLPVRKAHSTQGLSRHNVRTSMRLGCERLGISKYEFSFDNDGRDSIIEQPAFTETVQGKFPDIKEAARKITGQDIFISLAFNRKFAFRRDYIGPVYVQYKGKDIGYTDDFTKFKLHEDFKYLSESLEEIDKEIKIA